MTAPLVQDDRLAPRRTNPRRPGIGPSPSARRAPAAPEPAAPVVQVTAEQRDALAWLGHRFLGQEQFDRAIRNLRGLVRLAPGEGRFAYALALGLLYSDAYREAIEAASLALQGRSAPPAALLVRAQAYAALGDRRAALQDVRALLSIEPGSDRGESVAELARVLACALEGGQNK